MIHNIKSWPVNYDDIVRGQRSADIRKDDRDYQRGDELLLHCYDPELRIYTGQRARVRVVHVARNVEGIAPGYCVLSLVLPSSSTSYSADLAGATEHHPAIGEDPF